MKLTGNTFLITGGGSGIGRALAEALHQRGNQVIIAGRATDPLADVAAANPGMDSVVLDVCDTAAIARVVPQLIATYPKLDAVIHSAGIQREDDVGNTVDDDLLTATFATNLMAPIRLNSALIEHFRQLPSATIVNISSMLGFVPLANVALYCAAKAALHSYTLSQRYQLRDTSVKVLEIMPPYVQTALMDMNLHDPRAMPLEQFIAETLEALATDEVEVLVPRARERRDALRPGEVAATQKFNDFFMAGTYVQYGEAAETA
ncbi:SDR family oxidoreductase [Piscinibacter gummiphilus]|uniref:Short-chain dehydrogenase n=1 Tax=Piscinibacter gummiphilus TaxID=946333 RepID=A0A1W6LD37_9BURK|nr:SDR family NAD(P)-dependent oxidoreductase [Piscinibacter gummiphilus]ARN22170.1 short-chain dehydrogenase [Piscinibacter gummiphilus]ATU66858.1 short-chain dehydrogenase [Piscinibacter gummiphilus]GLS94263.1 oxidoreductase [Piscinibacter gummiphilus]